jgi:protein O-GlcNAc transferase
MAWSDTITSDKHSEEKQDTIFEANCSPVPKMPCSSPQLANGEAGKRLEPKDALSYANILRSRNKFAEAMGLYNRIIERDGGNVEALIGRGICLQMQGMMRQAFESFSEAARQDPLNACALTHCGVIYKDEGHLVEAAEVYLLPFVFVLCVFFAILVLVYLCGLMFFPHFVFFFECFCISVTIKDL